MTKSKITFDLSIFFTLVSLDSYMLPQLIK